MFQGVYTAVITPFHKGEIDYDAFYKILETQIDAKVSGVVPCGTTGESPTLSHEEHKDLIANTVKFVKGRVQVVAGTGSNSTREAVELTKQACADGVDGILSVNPYYNKPTQEGCYLHFSEIAKASSKPIMLYNIPGRTSINLQPELIARLSEIPNILSVKEATGDLSQMAKVISLVKRKEFTLLSGDDNLLLPILAIGGKGIVSVVSNLFPKTMVEIVNQWNLGNFTKSKDLFYKLFPLFGLAFAETNPIPIKFAMHHFGHCKEELRLPMTPMKSGESKTALIALIESLKKDGIA